MKPRTANKPVSVPQTHPPVHFPTVSVVMPARNEAQMIGHVVRAVLAQKGNTETLEVIVINDGSTDDTMRIATDAGARVISTGTGGNPGNPAAARNLGAESSTGDPVIFLDSDCIVCEGWLQSILAAHARGATIVGGSVGLPPGLSFVARCDFYCGWYLIHPACPSGFVPHHPPPNLSVRREPFLESVQFSTEPPLDYTNEERFWQAELQRAGHQIYFESQAKALHYNRPGFRNLLKRNYRWGYTAIEAKSQTGAARMAWLYRYPALLVALTPLLAIAHTLFIVGCWIRAGVYEPVVMLPLIFLSRVTYCSGMAMGAIRWLRYRDTADNNAPRPGPGWR